MAGSLKVFGKLLAIVTATVTSAHAYTPTLTVGGAQVRWAGEGKIRMAGNPVNQSGLDAQSFYQAVVRGFQRWQAASGGAASFDYWQGMDRAIYTPNSEYNGLSSIYFASNAGVQLSPNVLGLTQVWYNTSTGQILETDIVLNDLAYRFTTNPRDTSGYGASRASEPPPASGNSDGRSVFIENVITHEMGHAFGLSHSGGLQSTMLFMESPEQAFLGCDEQIGIRAIYPARDASMRGLLQGMVTAQSDQSPIFGAHVLAISRARGTVMATALTDSGGRYTISALEPGDYYLMAEPYFAGSSALPAFYSGMNINVCSGEPFSRTVLTEQSKSRPREVAVAAGQVTVAPLLVADCARTGGASVVSEPEAATLEKAPLIYDSVGNGFGVIGDFGAAKKLYYKLKNISGRVEIHAISYSIYSPVSPKMKLLNSAGSIVAVSAAEPVYQGASGFVNYDSALLAEQLPPGDYIIELASTTLNASQYPAGPVALDSVHFFILTGSVNEATPVLSNTLALNARCRMNENFGAYSSPPGLPPRAKLQTQNDEDKVGFCGTLDKDRGSGDGSSRQTSSGAITGWLLPWVFMFSYLKLRAWRARVNLVSI